MTDTQPLFGRVWEFPFWPFSSAFYMDPTLASLLFELRLENQQPYIVCCIYYTSVDVLVHVKITVPEVLETPLFHDFMTSYYVTMSNICIIYAKWTVWHTFGKCALSLVAVLAQPCVRWPIKADWVLGRGDLSIQDIKNQIMNLRSINKHTIYFMSPLNKRSSKFCFLRSVFVCVFVYTCWLVLTVVMTFNQEGNFWMFRDRKEVSVSP